MNRRILQRGYHQGVAEPVLRRTLRQISCCVCTEVAGAFNLRCATAEYRDVAEGFRVSARSGVCGATSDAGSQPPMLEYSTEVQRGARMGLQRESRLFGSTAVTSSRDAVSGTPFRELRVTASAPSGWTSRLFGSTSGNESKRRSASLKWRPCLVVCPSAALESRTSGAQEAGPFDQAIDVIRHVRQPLPGC